jgi:hypothetical protein
MTEVERMIADWQAKGGVVKRLRPSLAPVCVPVPREGSSGRMVSVPARAGKISLPYPFLIPLIYP